MEPDIVCEGYLTKAPPLDQPRSKWCYRYFTLDKSELVLKYYKDKDARHKSPNKKNDNAKGEIRLNTVQRINDRSEHAQANNYRHGFELDTNKRLWILIADTENDMVRWLSCLTSVFGESKRKTIVGSPNPSGSPKRSKSMLKKMGTSLGKIGPGSTSTLGRFEAIREDSSSSSHDELVSQFDEDDEEPLPHSKSVSSHMSSSDSAIGSEKSSKVRLTDGLPIAEPLYDEISQKEWMMKTNRRDTGDKVSVHISTTNDMLLPSQGFIMRSQIGSPTLSRTNVDGVYMFDQESDAKTPSESAPEGFYDFPTYSKKRPEEVESTYDTPAEMMLSSVRKVETVTKKVSIADEDLYDIPSNVIRSLRSDSLYDSLAPAEPPKQEDTYAHQLIDDIYDVPVLRKHKTSGTTEVDGQQGSGGARESPTPEAIYDTPPPKRISSVTSSVTSSTADFNPASRRTTGASSNNFSSTSSTRTTSVSSANRSVCRENSIDSAYQLLIIEDKELGGEVVPIFEDEPVYNIPPARPVPQPVSQQVLLPPPRTETRPVTPPGDIHPILSPDPTPPPSRSPPRPVLPPRTDRPPVPSRGQTLGRPARPQPEDLKPTRPQSDIICRPNRPVPQPPSAERETVHFEMTRGEQAGPVGTSTLTRAKINERDHHQASTLDRRAAPVDNEYIEVRHTPSPLRDIHTPPTPDRATPPPLVPRTSGPTHTTPRTISAGIGLSTMSAAVGSPTTPPRIPQRAGTIAGSTTNPFLDGFIPQREAATMSRIATPPRQFDYGAPNKSATLSASTPIVPMLNLSMSKQAQDEFDAIPDTPSPSDDVTRSRLAAPAPTIAPIGNSKLYPIISPSGNSKYPTIKNANIGMVKVKQGYMNVTEVKGALRCQGSSVQGERHSKLNRREVPARPAPEGYTPMDSMKDRMKKAVAAEKQGYEPMLSQQQRMALYNAQLQPQQQNPRPLPPRTLTVTGGMPCTATQPSPVYYDTTGAAPSPVYIEPETLQQDFRRSQEDQDITQLPEYIRMGEIDMTLNQEDYLPMSSATVDAEYLSMANWQAEYQTMDALGPQCEYLPMNPQDDYLAMGRSPRDDYLDMGRSPREEYLAMAPQGSGGVEYHNTDSGDNFSKLTFSNR